MPGRADSAHHLRAHAERLREIAETDPQLASELTRLARHLEAEADNLKDLPSSDEVPGSDAALENH